MLNKFGETSVKCIYSPSVALHKIDNSNRILKTIFASNRSCLHPIKLCRQIQICAVQHEIFNTIKSLSIETESHGLFFFEAGHECLIAGAIFNCREFFYSVFDIQFNVCIYSGY